MDQDSTLSNEAHQVIDSLYAAALSPENHDDFQSIWDRYLGSLDADDPITLKTLVQHIERALVIVDRLHFAGQTDMSSGTLVSREPVPAAVVDAAGLIRTKNTLWESADGGDETTLWRLTDIPEDQGKLRAVLNGLHSVADNRTELLAISCAHSGYPKFLAVRRLPAQTTDDGNDAQFLIRQAEPVWARVTEDFLVKQFALSPAEIALLEQISAGRSFAEIASGSQRSIDTIKAQSKSIYRKLMVSSREEATRLVLQLHLIAQPAQGHDLPKMTTAERKITLSSGRTLVCEKRGAARGTPFLFLHGMSLGHGMTRQFISGLKTRALIAHCLTRPGYGVSDPPHDWRYSVDEWVALFPELLDQLGLDRVPIVTHTSGVLYGCAAAAAYPSRVSGVLALAGGVPITDPAMMARYPLNLRVMARAARMSPTALRFLISTTTALFSSQGGADKTIHGTYGHVPADAAALDDPEIYGLVREGLTLVKTQGRGFDGFVGDGLKIFSDWSGYPSEMRAPLRYLIGEEDPICPLDWARSFAQKYNHIQVDSVPGAGQLLHHSHPQTVLGAIETLVKQAA
ncbi:MAG: alpha/beta fold hydrolase [Pseudomonadota bacterium]